MGETSEKATTKLKSMEEKMEDVNPIMYNWNLIKICYDLWYDDIVKSWKSEKKLYQIAGVGQNYINEICAGRIDTSRRVFNAEKDGDLIKYLRGSKRFMQVHCKKLKRYIVLKNGYNQMNTMKRKKQDCVYLEEWLQEQCPEGKGIYECLGDLRKEIETEIQQLRLKVKNAEGKEVNLELGLIKDYLMGVNHSVVVFNEIESYILNLAQVTMNLSCDKIAQTDDRHLDILSMYSDMLSDKIHAERVWREARRVEKEQLEKIRKNEIKREEEQLEKEEERVVGKLKKK